MTVAPRLPPQRLPADERNARSLAAHRAWADAQHTFSPAPDREARAESRAMKEANDAWRGALRDQAEPLPRRSRLPPRRPRPRRRAPTVPAAPAFRTASRAARARAKPEPEPPKPKPRARPTTRPRRHKPPPPPPTEKPWWARARDLCVNVAPPPPPPPDETPEHHLDKALSVVEAAKAEVRRRDAEAQKAAERDLDNAAEAVSAAAAASNVILGRGAPAARAGRGAPAARAGAARGGAKKPTAAPPSPPGPDPWVVSAMSTRYADARRAAARARDDDFLDRRPGESPSDAARRFVHDASTSPPRARPGQAASTAPDAPPRASGVDAEVDATPSYMKPTHRSGYRYKIDKTDGNWYRSDDPRMRPLDPRERVAVAAAGDAYAAACRARAHYHEIEQYGTFARSVALLTRRAAATLEQEARASSFRDAALAAHEAAGRATQAWRDAARSFPPPSPSVK